MRSAPLLLALLAGCAAPTWDADIGPLLRAECSGCHGGDEPEADFVIEERDDIVDVPATQADMALVTPGDALDSYLWHKLANTQAIAGGSGSAMPQGQVLDDADVERVRDWIEAGAP